MVRQQPAVVQPRFQGWHLKPYNKLSMLAGGLFVSASGAMIVEEVSRGDPVSISSILWLVGSLVGLGAVTLEQYAKHIEEIREKRRRRKELKAQAKNKPPQDPPRGN